MATITKGKTFVNGELVTPEKIHQLVDSATVTNIANADIAAGAAIADTKLAQISTAGKVLPAAVQGTAVITSDSRLSDARPPTTHTHDDRYYTEAEVNSLLAAKQNSLGFTPVQQGGGANQGTNKLFMGWSSDSQLRLQIDSTDFGPNWPINVTGTASGNAPASHTHDDRYYTETEMNTLLAGKQASGSYAPATGIAPSAITGTAVITTDSRLSDARTPTAHTHDASSISGTATNNISFLSANSSIANETGGLNKLEVIGTGGAAMMTFHRPGNYATYLGVDNDNQLKVGGWSQGNNSYPLLHSANFSAYAAPANHNHDDRYYTETEMNTLLAGKQATGSYVTNGGNVSSIQRVTAMPATPAANTLYIVIP